MPYDDLSDRVKKSLSLHKPPLDSVAKLIKYRNSEKPWTDISGIGPASAKDLDKVVAEAHDHNPSKGGREKREPKLFISHQHIAEVDVKIADKVRILFGRNTGNTVDIFQSSNATTGLKVGEAVPEGLRERLKDAELVILIYTRPEHDWGFCLWETGLAVDPERPEFTKIAVMSCCGAKPSMFRNHQIIDARDRESVRGFVNDSLASADLWPRYGKPVANFTRDGAELNDLANEFFDELQEIIPPDEEPSSWFFWPWLDLELPLEQAEKIEQHVKNDDEQTAKEVVKTECKVSSEKDVGPILRRQSLAGLSLHELHKVAEKSKDISTGWVEELIEGVLSGACGNWPEASCCRIRKPETNGKNWRLVMFRRDKIPSEQRFVFPVCFPPVQADADAS